MIPSERPVTAQNPDYRAGGDIEPVVVVVEVSTPGYVERAADGHVDEKEQPDWRGGCFVAELGEVDAAVCAGFGFCGAAGG